MKNNIQQLRECLADGKKAFFHKWISKYSVIGKFDKASENHISDAPLMEMTYGLVEFENGQVGYIEPDKIRFLDTSMQMFQDVCFSDTWIKHVINNTDSINGSTVNG